MRKSKTCWLAFGLSALWVYTLLPTKSALAQPGMGGGGGQAGAPAFVKPEFRDRVWEEGGPRIRGLRSGKLVRAIEIVGNQTISRHKILSYMQTRPDRNFDEKLLQRDIHKLYSTDLFRKIVDSTVEKADGVYVKLEVQELPTVTEVIFHGNRALNESMLVKHCGIKAGDPSNPFATNMARQRLIDLYLENGFNQVAIVVKEGDKAGDRRIYFDIAEGPKERIWNIEFIGNSSQFPSALLGTKIKSKSARHGATAYILNVANRNQIEEDKNTLGLYYRSLGYFQASVDYQVKYYDGGEFLDLKFVINEGPRFKIRNVSVTGNQFFSTETLMQALESKPGEYFHLGKMQRDQRTMRNEYYGREGFVYADIVPVPTFLEEPGMLDIVYRISEGDRYRAGEIRIHIAGDSSHTKHYVPLSLIGIRPGEFIDRREVELSEARLMRSQIFETNPTIGDPPKIEIGSPIFQNQNQR